MKRIKIAFITNHLDVMGISAVIMNYSKSLNHQKFDVTIIVGEPIASQYIEECNKYGISIVKLPSRHYSSIRHYFLLFKALVNGKFDIVHVHGNSSLMAIELTIAKLVGVKIRIAHSHNSTCPNITVHKFLTPYFSKIYTKAMACGILAGEWLFGRDNFEVLPNGFHTETFKFNFEKRNLIRKKLQIEDKFVIGHIGRFNQQKNQTYLLRIFEKVANSCKNAILLLVGNGPDFERVKSLVEVHPYKNRIILYGESNETNTLYSAMDLFVLPSLHEGLPVVLLEAQISGLPCLVSDTVTREMDFGNISWASIEADPQIWSDKILEIRDKVNIDRESYYEKNRKQILEYDISNNVKQLEKIYTDLVGE